jgi:GTP-binding protein
MFLDEAEIEVLAGRGGNGAVAFRREKYVPRGGPSGGHGGRGGHVILVADEGMNTLHGFRHQRRFAAPRGGHGGGAEKHGRDGEDLRVRVPVGTVVRDAASLEVIADLVTAGQEAIVARGGRGGRGNSAFKSAAHQAPRFAEKGEPGAARRLKLELKLIADVGIVGLPNAGKSTLLAAVSAARPKIADYPFTTLVPNLGVAEVDHEVIVLADIPGLIEGASQGAGLGDRFLRHIERTRLLVHLVDGLAEDPIAQLAILNAELAAYSPELAGRPQIVVVNKLDLPAVSARWPRLREAFERAGWPEPLAISAATGRHVPELLRRVRARLAELPAAAPAPQALPVIRPARVDEDAFTISREPDGSVRIRGPRVERAAAMTDWENDAAIARFQRILEAMGVKGRLRELGVADGTTVRIGEVELEWVV